MSTLEEGSKYLSVSHAVQNLNLTDCKFEALGTNLTYVVLLNSRRSNVSFHFGIHHEVMKWENLALMTNDKMTSIFLPCTSHPGEVGESEVGKLRGFLNVM